MKLVIAGSREWGYKHLDKIYQFMRTLPPDTEIVSGRARGVDSFAETMALRLNMKTTVFRADWKHYGHSAGFRRNIEMINYADRVVCFWDGQSKGTAHTIKVSKRQFKLWKIFYQDERVESFDQFFQTHDKQEPLC